MLGLVGWPWAEMVVCLGGLLVLQGWAGRESPGGDSLFFASPKKSKQKKGDPAVCDPSLRFGHPAVLSPAGVSCKLAFGSNKHEPLSVWPSAPQR